MKVNKGVKIFSWMQFWIQLKVVGRGPKKIENL